mgnify:CR=1 FL=1
MFKLAVFVSGRGSNLLAISSKINEGYLQAEISAVVSNKSDCKAIEFADTQNIPSYIVSDNIESKNVIGYTKLIEILKQKKIDLVILAGFLKKIPVEFIRAFEKKIINIHPALLPSFGGKGMYGSHVHRAIFDQSVKVSGPTVHFVDEIYDNGKIIAQRAIDITDVESPEEIAQRVLKVEHEILPEVIKKFTENKIREVGNRIFID